jgi:acetolactate synthase I/II/III large subunit
VQQIWPTMPVGPLRSKLLACPAVPPQVVDCLVETCRNIPMITTSQYLAYSLKRVGVRHAFGVSGANIEDLYDAMHHTGHPRCILAKHEFSAASMADGYARVGAPVGVVMATSGGGAANLIPGLAESYASRVPVLALVGQPPTPLEGRGAFQDGSGRAGSVDMEALFAAVSVYCRRVAHADAIPLALHDALAASLGEQPGPSVLLLPKDVQRTVVDPQARAFGLLPAVMRRAPALERVQAAAALLLEAHTVLIIAGEGVARHEARNELIAFVARLNARVAVTPDGRDTFDNSDPRFIGVTGAMGHSSVVDWLARADVCVTVGTRLPQLARVGLEAKLVRRPLVSVHFEPSFAEGMTRVEVIGNVRIGLRALSASLGPRASPAVAPLASEEIATRFLPGARSGMLGFREAIEAVAARLPVDANVFVDAGNTGASAVHWLRSPSRGRFVVALGMGGMGYSFGAAIGAALFNGRRTFVLAGDGAFYMHGLEIHTAVENRLPITFILFNNDAHAMCFTREYLYCDEGSSQNLFHPSDLAAGVGAMFPSLKVLPARTPLEIGEGLRGAQSGPAVMSIRVDPCEVPPFVPFLQAMASIDENRARKAG